MDFDAASALAFCRRAIARLDRVETEAARAAAAHDDGAPVERRLDEGLVVAYVVVEGEHLSPVLQAHLRVAGLHPDALHDNALANLATLARERAEVHDYGRVHAVLMGADLEASVLLCAPFWDDWHAALAPGGFVAAIPGRDVLAFGDAGSGRARRELDDLCTRMEPAVDPPLSDRLWRRIDGRWMAS